MEDESFGTKCVSCLKKIKKEWQAILIVSHIMKTTHELCDRVLWFEKGGLKLQGPTDAVLEK